MIIGAIKQLKKTHPWSLFPDWHIPASSFFFWRPRVFTCKCDEISPAKEACRKKKSSKPIVDDQIWQLSREHKKMRHLLIRHHCRRAASNNEEYRCMNKLSYYVVIYYFFPLSLPSLTSNRKLMPRVQISPAFKRSNRNRHMFVSRL